jgi:exonuclease SbcC
MIQNIELMNFRSHKNTKLTFTEGNNILVGISGSGKSSVLDAICFALFGTIPKIQKRKIKLSDLVMNKPFKEEMSKIKIVFRVDGKIYEITRKIYLDKPTEAELREDNKLTVVGPAQVNSAVEYILKINYDLFSRVVYAEQNQIDYFLSLPPGNRMNNIDELLKLEKFEIIRSKAISYTNKFKNLEVSKKETISTFDEKELIKKKEIIEKEINELTNKRLTIQKEIEKINKKLLDLEKNFENLKEKKLKVEELKRKLTKTEGIISIFEEELKKVKPYNLEELETKFKNKRKNLEKLEKDNLELEKNILRIDSRICELENQLKEKKEAENFLKKYDLKLLENLKVELNNLEKLIIETKLRRQTNLESLEKLKTVGDKCPICDTELSNSKRNQLIELRERKILDLNEKISDLDESAKNLKIELKKEAENFEKAKFFEKRFNQLTNVEKNLKELIEELLKTKSKKIDTTEFKKEVEELKALYEKIKDIEEKKKKIELYRREKDILIKDLANIPFDENLLEKTREELEILKTKKTCFEKDLEFILKIISEKEKFFKQIVKDITFLEKNKKEIRFLNYAHNTLSKLSKILVEVQEILRQEFVKTLNEVMNEIWNDIYPYEDYIGIRFKIEEKDYLLQLCDLKNKWMNVEGFSSGGERAIASLVMRIALSVILAPKLKILILDEPTHNLDTNTIENLIEILRTRITDLIEQLFIVTHDERLIQAGTGFTYEFMRESAKKEPTSFKKLNYL